MAKRAWYSTREGETFFDIFKVIFSIFDLSFITSLPREKLTLSTVYHYFVFSVGIAMWLNNSLFMVWFLYISEISPGALASLFVAFVASITRLTLRFRLKYLKELSKELSKSSKFLSEKDKLYGFICWIACIIATIITLTVISFSIQTTETGYSKDILGPFIGIEIYRVLLVLYQYFFWFGLVMPTYITSVYYALICYHLKDITTNFKDSLACNMPADYTVLLGKFREFEKKIRSVNTNLEFLAFCNVLFTSGVMYLAVSAVIHNEKFGTEIIPVFILSFCSFPNFLLMIVAAIMLNDSLFEFSEKAKALPSNSNDEILAQLKFYFDVQKDMSITIWGMGSIRRNLILAMFGTIFTYCVLVDGIWSMKNKDL